MLGNIGRKRNGTNMFEDKIALANTSYITVEVECIECEVLEEIEVESEYHRYTKETTWWGKYTCSACGYKQEVEGWF